MKKEVPILFVPTERLRKQAKEDIRKALNMIASKWKMAGLPEAVLKEVNVLKEKVQHANV